LKTIYQSKLLISILIGTAIYFILFGFKSFCLADIEWLKDTGDFTMNYSGWGFYRNDPWTFPLVKTISYGYPVGSSLVYTDSIPVFAFLFKIISPLLPAHFQYFTLWVWLITIAQVYVAAKILSLFIKDYLAIFTGAILLIFCPVFMSRAYLFNVALGSHFILLYCIYLFISQRQKKIIRVRPWVILFILSSIIHPQLTLIGYLIFVGHLCGLFITRSINLKRALVALASVIAATVATAIVFGIFDPGVKAAGSGFGYYTFNFNSFINPMYIPTNIGIPLSQNGGGQGDGQSYLGAGLILCLVPFFIYLARTGRFRRFFSKEFLAFHIIIVCGAALACAGNISFGKYQLIRVPIPEKVAGILSFARASSRFIWPCYYLLYVYLIIFTFSFFKKKIWLARTFLLVALGLQIFDLFPFLSFAKGRFDGKPEVTVPELKSFLKETASINKHIFLYPTDKSYYNSFSFEAIENKQTQNAGYFARDQTGAAVYADNLINDVLVNGKKVDSTIMVLKNKNLPILIDSLHPGEYNFFRIQNFDMAVLANPQLAEKYKSYLFKPQSLTEGDIKASGMITLLYNNDDFASICATKPVVEKLNAWCPKGSWAILDNDITLLNGAQPDSLTGILAKKGFPYFGTAVSKKKGRTIDIFNHTFYVSAEKSLILQLPLKTTSYMGINLYY